MTRLTLLRGFWLLVCAAGVIGMVSSGWLMQAPAPTVLPEAAPAKADYYLRDAEVDVTDDSGRLSYRMKTAELLRFSDHSSRLTDVVFDSLGGNDGVWQLKAGQAVISENQEHLHLSGGVQMRTQSPQGPTLLTTQSLKVALKDKQLTTADAVHIEGPEFITQAIGMQAGFKSRNLTLMNKVQTRYAP